MLDRSFEYYKMSQVESKHWWYRNLHETVYDHIDSFETNSAIAILDCGCGTGGCISFLSKKGYENIHGFDLSEDAVNIFRQNMPDLAANIRTLDIRNARTQFEIGTFDVIISSDVLYFLSKSDQQIVLSDFYNLLKKNGIVILNLPALKAFGGIHDKAVGIEHRFNKNDIEILIERTHFQLKYFTFRLFLLSPLVYFERLIQRIKIKLLKNVKIESDIDLPPKIINNLLYRICNFEKNNIRKAPFGSSIFCVLEKTY